MPAAVRPSTLRPAGHALRRQAPWPSVLSSGSGLQPAPTPPCSVPVQGVRPMKPPCGAAHLLPFPVAPRQASRPNRGLLRFICRLSVPRLRSSGPPRRASACRWPRPPSPVQPCAPSPHGVVAAVHIDILQRLADARGLARPEPHRVQRRHRLAHIHEAAFQQQVASAGIGRRRGAHQPGITRLGSR